MEESDDEEWIAWYKYCPNCWQEYEEDKQRVSIARQPVLLAAHVKKYKGKEISPETVKEWIKATPHNKPSALNGCFPPTLRCENLKFDKDSCVFAPRFDEKISRSSLSPYYAVKP